MRILSEGLEPGVKEMRQGPDTFYACRKCRTLRVVRTYELTDRATGHFSVGWVPMDPDWICTMCGQDNSPDAKAVMDDFLRKTIEVTVNDSPYE